MVLKPRFRLLVPNIPLLKATGVGRIIDQERARAITELIETGATIGREETPVGATVLLRGTIATQFSRGTQVTARGEVVWQQPYAEFVERGRRPGRFPPRAPIELWAQRVLGNAKLWFVVARSIARKGTKPNPFFERTRRRLEAHIPAVKTRLAEAIRRRLMGR